MYLYIINNDQVYVFNRFLFKLTIQLKKEKHLAKQIDVSKNISYILKFEITFLVNIWLKRRRSFNVMVIFEHSSNLRNTTFSSGKY